MPGNRKAWASQRQPRSRRRISGIAASPESTRPAEAVRSPDTSLAPPEHRSAAIGAVWIAGAMVAAITLIAMLALGTPLGRLAGQELEMPAHRAP